MPPLPVLTQPSQSRGTLPRPITGSRNTPDARPPIDLNRPLPPPPSTSADNYDIPALRNRVLEESSSSNPPKHNRSFSHPFPSFFGSKRADKKNGNRQNIRTPEAGRKPNEWDEDSSAGTPSVTPSQSRSDRQPVTGRCMTCDSTVRWPQGLKVFRCTTCLTINDLEPYVEDQSKLTDGGQNVQFKAMPISLEQTRSIIDISVRQYLESKLNDPLGEDFDRIQDATNPLVDDIDSTQRPSHLVKTGSPPSSPRPLLKVRSPSDSTVQHARLRNQFSNMSLPSGPSDPFLRYNSSTIERVPSLNLHDLPTLNTNPASIPRSSCTIFRGLESYISTSFTGCASLNSSFFTIKPQSDPRNRTNSDPKPLVTREKRSASNTTPLYEPEVFLSELDAKTLLLGDVAENGSWWSGGRGLSSEHANHQRDRSPEKWRGLVSIKTPRINWIDLVEWYRIVINAGESWKRIWHGMKLEIDEEARQKWTAIPMDQIQHEINESQIHLQRSLLKATENLLKRPRRPLKHPEDCRFLLMLLANPLLHPSTAQQVLSTQTSSAHSRPSKSRPAVPDPFQISPTKRSGSSARRPGSLGHHSGIIKRILGLMSNSPNDVHQFFTSWFSRFSDGHFQRTVELIGSFVTYRLSRQQRRPVIEPINPTDGLVPSFSDTGVRHASQLHAALEVRPSTASTKATDNNPKLAVYGEDWQVKAAARTMALLFQANVGHTSRKRDASSMLGQKLDHPALSAKYQAYTHGQIIPISNFYNTMLDYADLVGDFEVWETTKSKFTFCQYPFFLSIYAKIHILEHDARRQMEVKAREAFFDSILSRKAVSQYLVLRVRRDCLVEDSLRSVSEVVGAGSGEIKKGLRIDFVNEEGIDAGGLRKEWFLLLVREIFDPYHGLFVYDEDSQYCYFNPFCFESSEQFFLVGVLLGLAIYNSTILDVPFPPFVFKKMLASAPVSADKLTSTPRLSHTYTLEDLAELRPVFARGLRQLLEFEGNVEETFCRDFVAEMDRYGEIVRVPLCPGGEKRAVTNTNRREFVDLYIRYLLDTQVARQFEPFKRGFFSVCGGNALSLFRPEEIELLIRGSDEPLDIASLRAVATYEGWPKAGGPPEQQAQVVWFWNFFERISPSDQRKLLSFITGSDRIPAMGATNLVIKIGLLRDNGPEAGVMEPERFPIARTCFNYLSLHPYRSRDKLEEKLWTAVTESEGFGLK